MLVGEFIDTSHVLFVVWKTNIDIYLRSSYSRKKQFIAKNLRMRRERNCISVK